MRNRKLQLFILLTLVCLVGTMSIAYAVLSTTLNINGTAQVQDASWNVHFDNVQVNPYSVEINPVITDNNKVSFSADLTTPGDFYKFTVDIVNEGSIDAMIESIIKSPELTTEQQSKYVRYEVEYVDGTSINDSQLLKSGETKTLSILFSYRNDIPTSDLPSSETEFDLEIVLVYVQADSTGTEISGTDSAIKVVSGDLNTVGSEICIGEECFYLMKNDGYSVTMLAKYNLYVGNKYDSTNGAVELDDTTGLQDLRALGWHPNWSEQSPNIAVVPFSETNYWHSNRLNAVYGTVYPAYVYDSNSLLYSYITNYKDYLKQNNIDVKIRLILKNELEKLGCIEGSGGCLQSQYSWIYQTSYWTGTAGNYNGVWGIYKDGSFSNSICTNNDRFGIRPVIEIPLTEF